MGKSMQHQDPPNIGLQNGNSGGINKLFHALNRRHRWQNVRKELPDKRKGSGKHIIDGTTSESTASTSQPTQVQGNRKKNKTQIEQASTEAGPITVKNSKKFRIRSLLADEMSKRRGKGQPRRGDPRRSPSPTRSPSKRNGSPSKRNDSRTPTKGAQNSCESPSTIKKRKCNICAAMLTVSYLRQKGQAYEHQKKLEVERNKSKRVSDGHKTHSSHPTKGLTRSFSFPLLGSAKSKDSELEELKRKLRNCKDKETTKEKFLLPMNQWKDNLVPKPMLTRPASFRSPSFKIASSSSQKENKQTPTNQNKNLRQKIGRVMKESKDNRDSRENRKKEKRRILMDAVFHKIPYGRRNSKDPKKLSADKIKSNSTTGSTGSHRMAVVDQANLKKTASTGEALRKYSKLLSQTSIREDKSHVNDHKPRLCVAGDQSGATNERITLTRIHSVPVVGPSDLTQDQEFPIKTEMDAHQSIASTILDDHKSLDQIDIAAKLTVPTPAIQKLVNETKKHETADKKPGVGLSSSDNQEKTNNQKEPSAIETETKKTKLDDKDDAVEGNVKVDLSTPGHQEKVDHQKESSAAVESEVKETKLVDKDKHVDEKLVTDLKSYDSQEKIDHQKETSAVIEYVGEQTDLVEKRGDVDENLGVDLITSDHEHDIDQQKESVAAIQKQANETALVEKDEAVDENIDASLNRSVHEEKNEDQKETSATKGSPEIEVDNDKSFKDSLGTFKKVEKDKLDEEIEPSAAVHKVVIGATVNKDEGTDTNLEVDQSNLDHEEEERSQSSSDSEGEGSILMEDALPYTPSLVDTPHSLADFVDENQQYLFSIDDQPSTPDQPSTDSKRPYIDQPSDMSTATTVDDHIPENVFLHLDLDSVKDNIEFQFVRAVLKRSGFLGKELLGEWYSSYQPIDPSLFEEVEASFLQTKNLDKLDEASQKIINNHHLLLFDLINEALLEIHNKTCTFCPDPLVYGSKVRPTPVGYRVLEEVWDIVNMYLSWRPDLDQASLDDAVSRDVLKGDGWMNLQADAEIVGIELEEMIADDLLDELVFDDLLM